MKLEIKHIAPYLPFELKCCLMGEQDEETGKPIRFLIEGANNEFVEVWSLKTITDQWTYEEVFPILRPLSDLTKEMENNGEKFIPLEKLGWNSYDDIIKTGNVLGVSYLYIQQLLEWHFDVFGLIEKGLAIDINTLEK